MKIGRDKKGRYLLKMSDGSIRHFKSKSARDRFERYAEAYKRGWRPTRKK